MYIAQVTDTHIDSRAKATYDLIDTATSLESSVAAILDLGLDVDACLITGDLVHHGLRSDYELLRKIIKPLPMPIFMIPGNHDDRETMRDAFPDMPWLSEHGQFIQYAIDDFPLRLIGLDTTVAGEDAGELCEQRLEWLDRELGRAPDRPTLIFMHHPPFRTGLHDMDAIGLHNAESFGLLLERHPQVIRIVCGHVHRKIDRVWHGILCSIAPSTAHSVALDLRTNARAALMLEPGAFELHWYDGGGVTTYLGFADAFPGPFNPGSGESA